MTEQYPRWTIIIDLPDGTDGKSADEWLAYIENAALSRDAGFSGVVGMAADAAAEIERLRAAILAFVAGDYPNPACHRPGRCAHGTLHTDECAECAAEYFRGVLGDG